MTNSLSKQVPMNLLTNMGVFVFNIIINLFMTPFYIKYVGIDGLGVVRLALLLPVYINLATLVISGAVSRFLTISLHEKNHDNANITFNTSFFSISTILIIAVPLVIYFAFHITSFLNIPDGLHEESIYLFLGIFLSSQITVFSTLFLIPAYANNRLDIQNYIKIATLFIQTSVIIISFVFIASNIAFVGYAYIGSALLGLVLSALVWKEFAPFLVLSKSFMKFSKFKEIASMGSWLLVNQLGSILFLSVDLIIINYFLGTEATGEYSIVLQWSILLRSLAGMLASVLSPIILISYANKNFEDIVKYAKFAVKFMGIFMAIPIGLIAGFAIPLLSIWLGTEYISLTPLLWLVILPLAINLAIIPLFSLNTAYNKVKIPGIASIGFGLVNIVLAILLVAQFHMGLYGVALASAIVLTLKNVLFTPLYASYVLQISKMTFFIELKFSIIVLFISLFFSYGVTSIYQINTWIELLLGFVITTCLIGIVLWVFILSDNDIKYIKSKIKKGQS